MSRKQATWSSESASGVRSKGVTSWEVYDLAIARRWKEPAILRLGDRCVIGEWTPLAEIDPNDLICATRSRGILVRGEGSTWEEAARAAGLL